MAKYYKIFYVLSVIAALSLILCSCAKNEVAQKLYYPLFKMEMSSEAFGISCSTGDEDLFNPELQQDIDGLMLSLPLDSDSSLATYAWQTLVLFHAYGYISQDYIPAGGTLYSNYVLCIWYASEEQLENRTRDCGTYIWVDSSDGSVLAITDARYRPINP